MGFTHTKARAGSHNIGDPIKSFKKQWEIMLRELGYWEEWGTSPTDKLVPYSLRGFAITMAIREVSPPSLWREALALLSGCSNKLITTSCPKRSSTRLSECLAVKSKKRSNTIRTVINFELVDDEKAEMMELAAVAIAVLICWVVVERQNNDELRKEMKRRERQEEEEY